MGQRWEDPLLMFLITLIFLKLLVLSKRFYFHNHLNKYLWKSNKILFQSLWKQNKNSHSFKWLKELKSPKRKSKSNFEAKSEAEIRVQKCREMKRAPLMVSRGTRLLHTRPGSQQSQLRAQPVSCKGPQPNALLLPYWIPDVGHSDKESTAACHTGLRKSCPPWGALTECMGSWALHSVSGDM